MLIRTVSLSPHSSSNLYARSKKFENGTLIRFSVEFDENMAAWISQRGGLIKAANTLETLPPTFAKRKMEETRKR